MNNGHCNHCKKEMDSHVDIEAESVPAVCTNRECSAYGLLQITAEKMKESRDL